MCYEPKIYVACLAAYNNGQLHGRWIVVEDQDQVREQIQQMLAASPQPNAEEWAIHDHSDMGIWVGEYASIERVCNIAEFVRSHDCWGQELLDYCGGDIEQARHMAENYMGSCNSWEDWVEDFYRETYPPIPDELEYYVNWDAMARDWQANGYYVTIECEGATHVFHNC